MKINATWNKIFRKTAFMGMLIRSLLTIRTLLLAIWPPLLRDVLWHRMGTEQISDPFEWCKEEIPTNTKTRQSSECRGISKSNKNMGIEGTN